MILPKLIIYFEVGIGNVKFDFEVLFKINNEQTIIPPDQIGACCSRFHLLPTNIECSPGYFKLVAEVQTDQEVNNDLNLADIVEPKNIVVFICTVSNRSMESSIFQHGIV